MRNAAWPLALLWLMASTQNASAHGCIAVRGGSMCPLTLTGDDRYLASGDTRVATNFQWFQSDRHFIGDDEFTLPNELGAEAINESWYMDINVQHAWTDRITLSAVIPWVYSTRSTLYEHDNINRHTTSAGGLGDIRIAAHYWLLDPAQRPDANLTLGMGPKLPTGQYDAQDTFYTSQGPVKAAVDQSIQPGDGGFGWTLELNGFYRFAPDLDLYLQGYYLFNPRNTNGVETTPNDRPPNPYQAVNSVPDQYIARLGLNYAVKPAWGMVLSLGGRIEGVPVRDVFGASEGFRRPGYAVFIEPGIHLTKQAWSFDLSVPVAVYRNRLQSLADKKLSDLTGLDIRGDAAFADYVISANLSFQF
ncbi:transporter [Thiorhodococcus minor]|uniref:Transporter n=1 Tax=Thiorhodococcus minor TaxID=57489 RepID=A0A6M0JTH2_9GAMM|nr:transporter [Thiorhodococcus minor]NEV60424.1 transporter [Thiorhodococcus minor]